MWPWLTGSPSASATRTTRTAYGALVWGEDDTRRVMPRGAIDPEFLNPLFNARMAELWRRDAP